MQLTKYSADKDNQSLEIEEINKKMLNIISNRVGASDYDNFADDQVLKCFSHHFFNYIIQMLRFQYEGTIRRQVHGGDTIRSRASLSSHASDFSRANMRTKSAGLYSLLIFGPLILR